MRTLPSKPPVASCFPIGREGDSVDTRSVTPASRFPIARFRIVEVDVRREAATATRVPSGDQSSAAMAPILRSSLRTRVVSSAIFILRGRSIKIDVRVAFLSADDYDVLLWMAGDGDNSPRRRLRFSRKAPLWASISFAARSRPRRQSASNRRRIRWPEPSSRDCRSCTSSSSRACVQNANGIVGAPNSDARPVRRQRMLRIRCHSSGLPSEELRRGDVPYLHFAELSRSAAAGYQQFTVCS